MQLCLRSLADMRVENNPSLTWEQRIEILQKAIAIFDIVYDKGDYNMCTDSISGLYRDMSEMAVRAGNFELALKSLEKVAEYAKAADELPEKKPYVSLLVNRLVYNAAEIGKNYSSTSSKMLFRKLSESVYDKIRDDLRFQAVENSLRKLA